MNTLKLLTRATALIKRRLRLAREVASVEAQMVRLFPAKRGRPNKRKGALSRAGRAAIVAGQKKRWAKKK